MATTKEASTKIVFFVNGRKVVERNAQPQVTLLEYIRNNLRLCGTKLGCGTGQCGACTVMASAYDHQKKSIKHFTLHGCLTSVCSVDGLAITTVEGIGSTRTKIHPVQERLAKAHGTQCGFCSPGMVMSMYTLLRNNSSPSEQDIEQAIEGNLCRCTGYRPILDGFKTFSKEWCCGGGCGDRDKTKEPLQDEQGSGKLFDASKFVPYDPTQDPIFPPELMQPEYARTKPLLIKGEHVTWIRPVTLQKLLKLKEEYPQAKLIAGTTIIGFNLRLPVKRENPLVLIAVSYIPELHVIERGEDGVKFGASVSMTTMMDELQQVVDTFPEYKTRAFVAILERLKLVAVEQIRNVASIGGHIVCADPASDLNPLLVALRCTLDVVSTNGKKKVILDDDFFVENGRTSLKLDEILLSVTIPNTQKNEFVHGFKQARRYTCGLTFLGAGMRVLLEAGPSDTEWLVKECTICYGGFKRLSHTMVTEKGIKGRHWDETLVTHVSQLLAEEIEPSASDTGNYASYRRLLVQSFFFRFYLKVLADIERTQLAPAPLVTQKMLSATLPVTRKTTKSLQTFQEIPPGREAADIVGSAIPHMSALEHTTGEAVYCDDMPKYQGELYLARVLSKHGHAKIISIDASDALQKPGVHSFISAEDVPGSNMVLRTNDEEVFATEKVFHKFQTIGAIVADTKFQAQKAASAVKVIYKDLPVITTIEDAIAAKSFMGADRKLDLGNIETGFKMSDKILEREIYLAGQEHYYMETQASIAVPKGEKDEIEIYSSTQSPDFTQDLVAHALGIPTNRIVVRAKRAGGAFGGKGMTAPFESLPVAISAYKTGRPVRFMLDRSEDMARTGKRHPFLLRYKVGFSTDGKLQALELEAYCNGGYSLQLSQVVLDDFLTGGITSAYHVPNIRACGRICRTNLPSNTACRALGTAQAAWFMESVLSDVALACGISERKVRELNMYRDGQVSVTGNLVTSCTLDRCLNALIKKCSFEERQRDNDKYNNESRWKKRGIGLSSTYRQMGFTGLFFNQGGALVHIYKSGSVLVSHGGTEMGQGLHTKLAQVAAQCLGVPLSYIHISETATNTVPNTFPTAASTGTELNGHAVKNACKKLRERLLPFKVANPGGSWEDWVQAAYFNRVSLSSTGFYRTPEINQWDFDKSCGNPFLYHTPGVACSEVEIDCLTGDHKVLRTDVVMDVGNSLNPAIDVGQIEGAFLMGQGLYTLEELVFLPDGGLVLGGDPGAYKIPSVTDIPTEFNVHLLRDAPNEKGLFSSKAVGEAAVGLAISVFNGIRQAVTAARRDAGVEGYFRFDSPATCERIRLACVDQFTNKH